MEIYDKKNKQINKQTKTNAISLSDHDLGLPVPKAGEMSNKSCKQE